MASSVLLRSLRRRDLASGSLSAYKTLPGNAKSSLGATYSASKWAALARPFCSRPPANEVIGIGLGTTNEGKNPRVIENSEGSRTTHSIAKATLGLTQAKQIEPPKISFAAKEIDPVEWKGDMLAVAVTEKDMAKDNNSKFQNPLLQKLDSQLHGLLSKVSVGQDFTGKSGQSTFLILSSFGIEMVGLVGLGSAASPTAAYRSLGKAVAAAAKSAQASNVAIALASSEVLSAGLKLTTASAIASGTVIGTYEDTRFKSKSKKPTLKSVDIIGLGVGSEIEKKFKQAEFISSTVIFGKNLVNAPANVLTPAVLAEEARMICSMYSDVLTVNILNEEQFKELKMGAYLAVAEEREGTTAKGKRRGTAAE